jgi:hypothetical protein
MSATATAAALTSSGRGRPGRPSARRPGVWVPVAGGSAGPGVAPARGAAVGGVVGGTDRPSAAVGTTGPGSVGGCEGNAWVIGSGSQPGTGGSVLSSVRICSVLGRWCGSLARHRSTSGRSSVGRPVVSGEAKTTRYSRVALGAVPNGPWPVAAKVSSAPRLNTSLGGPTRWPRACSGDMKPGEPSTGPLPVSMLASAACEMPKSMIRGPSSASSTFDGFRSRCTMPAAWIAPRPSASPAASASTDLAGSGPCLVTVSASDSPGT